MDDIKKEPKALDGKDSNDLELKIQKALDLIASKVNINIDLTINITEQFASVCNEFLNTAESNKVYFNQSYILLEDEWFHCNVIYKLIDVAIKSGIDINKVHSQQTRFINIFKKASAYRASNNTDLPKFEYEKQNNKAPTMVLVDEYIKEKYPKTSVDIVSDIIDFKRGHKRFDDVIIELKMKGINVNIKDFETYLRSDNVNQFDPFKEYFGKLPKWNGELDHIAELASYIKTNDDPYFSSMFKKHLVRSVGQALNKEVNRFCIVLHSEKESLGKTTFIRFLNPFEKGEYYSEAVGKDLELTVTKCFIINMEELDNMKHNEHAKLKAIISSETLSIRRFFTQTLENKSRRASFWASTNSLNFLGEGENTRWIVIDVKEVDHSYNDIIEGKPVIDIDLVWSQALHLYETDFNTNLTSAEQRKATEIASDFKYLSNEAVLILENLLKSNKHCANSTDIATYFKNILPLNATVSINKIGRAMNNLKFEKGNNGTTKGYMVETKTGISLQDAIRTLNVEISQKYK